MPETVAIPQKTTPTLTWPRTPSTTASPRPPPPAATVRPVKQNTWTPSEHPNILPIPAQTV